MRHSSPLLETGTVLHDTYQVVRRVGTGGMGEVWEASHARIPGRFAIKVLAARVEGGSAEFRRFRREAEIASTLRHPNIVQVIDFNVMDDGSPYLVMEFLEGTDLANEMERIGRLLPRRVAGIVDQVAAALSVAHAGGVIHRDLKPQNVFLVSLGGRGGEMVKVVDFGISKVKSAATFTTEPGLIGTPQYMAPEQAHGRAQEVEARTDQFALAAMAYEMLSGKRAFDGDSVPAILFEVASKDPRPLPQLVPWVGADVWGVIRKGLAKRRESRFGSIGEFSDALAAALGRLPADAGTGARTTTREASDPGAPTQLAPPEGDPGTLRPSVSTARPWGGKRVSQGRGWAIAAGLVVLAGGGGAWFILRGNSDPSAVARVPEPAAVSPAPEQAPTSASAPRPELVQLPVGRTRAAAPSTPDAGVPASPAGRPGLVGSTASGSPARRLPVRKASNPTRKAGEKRSERAKPRPEPVNDLFIRKL